MVAMLLSPEHMLVNSMLSSGLLYMVLNSTSFFSFSATGKLKAHNHSLHHGWCLDYRRLLLLDAAVPASHFPAAARTKVALPAWMCMSCHFLLLCASDQ